MWYPRGQQVPSSYRSDYSNYHSCSSRSYSKIIHYSNQDQSLTTHSTPIHDENDSATHCQTMHGALASNYSSVVNPAGLYVDEMSSYRTNSFSTPPNDYRSPVIVAPNKTSLKPNSMGRLNASSSNRTLRWDWSIFPPEFYPELYYPTTISVSSPADGETFKPDTLRNHLPAFLLTLLAVESNSLSISDDEHESDREIRSLPLSNSSTKQTVHSNDVLADEGSTIKLNRSSTPDTDDGYQSASDASRSDYSHASSLPIVDTTTTHEEIVTIATTRLSYAAAVKPVATNRQSFISIGSSAKPKQTMKDSLPTIIDSNESVIEATNQKLKFIAPRFERMHHAKQSSSSSTTSFSSNGANTKKPSGSSTNRASNRNNNHQLRSQPIISNRRR